MIRYFRIYFVPVSFVFLIIALYRANYLKVPVITSPLHIVLAVLFMNAGFIISTLCWQKMLVAYEYRVSVTTSIASIGLSVFGKYIPGKVWIIVGRAAYVAQVTGIPLGRLSMVSLKVQLTGLWTALSLGIVGLLMLAEMSRLGAIAGILWLGMAVLVFSQQGECILKIVGRRLLKRELTFQKLDAKSIIRLLPWFVLTWGLWSAGFYFLVTGLLSADFGWSVGLAIPLAVALGILAVVVPGGLGVRESVLAGYLAMQGIALSDATTVAVVSRLWFLIGEVFIFVVGVLAHTVSKQRASAPVTGATRQPVYADEKSLEMGKSESEM